MRKNFLFESKILSRNLFQKGPFGFEKKIFRMEGLRMGFSHCLSF